MMSAPEILLTNENDKFVQDTIIKINRDFKEGNDQIGKDSLQNLLDKGEIKIRY